MRMLKTLAVVLAGMLLLALPAVAIPQGPRPGTPECAGERAEAEAEAKQKGEPAPADPCTGSSSQCSPEEGAPALTSALDTTTCSVGGVGGLGDGSGGLGGT